MVRPRQSKHKQKAEQFVTRAKTARVSSARKNSGRLSGKVAVVTGASRGIGLAIARALAREGSSVVITGRYSEALTKAADRLRKENGAGESATPAPNIMPIQCDVRDEHAVERMFGAVAREFGRVDVLVNNAGVSQPALSVEKTTIELWHEIIDTNLTGTFLCSKSALPLIPRGGTVVNILSAAARIAFPSFAAYNSSKHGALGFTLTLREELKERGIRVCAFMPGATDTAMWQQIMPNVAREKLMDADSTAALVLSIVLLPPKANLSELALHPITGAI
jgi:NAD(P)-dependent dehydrogenase (short-subunit alcohol dehydrogenase family)